MTRLKEMRRCYFCDGRGFHLSHNLISRKPAACSKCEGSGQIKCWTGEGLRLVIGLAVAGVALLPFLLGLLVMWAFCS